MGNTSVVYKLKFLNYKYGFKTILERFLCEPTMLGIFWANTFFSYNGSPNVESLNYKKY